ncbi:DUF1648 domain-containing protein [Chryseobacterium chendengshani]|uniref:DUF1648 domain-containing protein n=1 Tax=Chryseobacterium sp. LJ756 TaxID=2864113 RepID=UPI001C6439C8|nr:DUF1648 domain-containing protein [Chryseobacterium sp. LJ756]MBW7675770.1 DUF1648 domain-containing protein [Chryseobacterium sp. LJ756]
MKTSSILLVINILLLIFIWGFTGVNYAGLPETLPSHFAVNGTVDGESEKRAIWFLPGIATFVSLLLVGIPKNPDSPLLNVPNSYRNRESLKLFAYSILLSILLLLSDTVVESILIAQGKLREMSNAVFVFLALLFVVIGIHIFRMLRERKSETSKI